VTRVLKRMCDGKRGCVCDRVVVRGEEESNRFVSTYQSNQESVHTRFAQGNLLELPRCYRNPFFATLDKVLCRFGYRLYLLAFVSFAPFPFSVF
jgi:hypothetical protein